MKSVSILIPNRVSFEMIELCILSIRHYTSYPSYKIIVHDDYSCFPNANGTELEPTSDLIYLRECKKKGWIELHENVGPKLKHGKSLNKLLNEICDTDYAVVMDADVQIKGHNWLWDLINVAEADPKIIAVVNGRTGGFAYKLYRLPVYHFQLGLINMRAYNDGMRVDWNCEIKNRKDWPYCEEFKDFYPPENCKKSNEFFNNLSLAQRSVFDAESVIVDPGAKLYIQVRYYNPKGYKTVPLPNQLREKYYHYGHISMIAKGQEHKKEREEKFSTIKEELRKLKKT